MKKINLFCIKNSVSMVNNKNYNYNINEQDM